MTKTVKIVPKCKTEHKAAIYLLTVNAQTLYLE